MEILIGFFVGVMATVIGLILLDGIKVTMTVDEKGARAKAESE